MRQIRIHNVIAEGQSIIAPIIAGVEDTSLEDVKISNMCIMLTMGLTLIRYKPFQ